MNKYAKFGIMFGITTMLIIGGLHFSEKSYAVNNSKYSNRIICIDPGHQKRGNSETEPISPGSKIKKAKVSSGTTGTFTKVPEYKLTLEISLKLQQALKKEGFKVVMTRESNDVNISNAERAKIANNAKADISIRIHADGSNKKNINGISILYPSKESANEQNFNSSRTAADIVLKSVINETKAKNLGIVPRSDLTGFNWSEVPSILIETGFMTNVNEDKKLQNASYQDKIVKGITLGIEKYIDNMNDTKK